MPGLSGLEVLDRLRSDQRTAELPVLMATVRSASEDIVDALGRGANDYVTKPIDFPVLLARLTTLPLIGEVPKVLDFGIAKVVDGAAIERALTLEGAIVGTPTYMAPERFQGHAALSQSQVVLGSASFRGTAALPTLTMTKG